MNDQSAPLLRVSGVSKSFFGNVVLHGVDLEVYPGQVLGLVGENGAGKSTLMKILAGVQSSDSGTIEFDGSPVSFTHPVQAQQAGLATVFQEFNLLPERTIAENIYLGREPRTGPLVDRAAMVRNAQALLTDLNIEGLNVNRNVGTLSVAEQQVVEIAKAVSFDAKLIQMDEPTAALAGHEVELLYSIIEELTSRGVAIVYVSHRLREILDLTDVVTILKDGQQVATAPTRELDEAKLVRHMVGRDMETFFPPALPGTEVGEVALQLDGVGNGHVDDVSLAVRAGEIVAIAGLQGSGRTELLEGIFGIAPFSRGQMSVAGVAGNPRSARAAIRSGLALVTEDRKGTGLALGQSILDNAMGVVRSVRAGRSRAARAAVPALLDSLAVRARSLSQEVQFLSGGNQQKVVLARWLATEPKVVLLDEPTRGVDVGAKHSIYEVIRQLAAQGLAVVMVSSELPEVIGMADRILVMRDGRLAGELPAGTSEEAVLSLAAGVESGVA